MERNTAARILAMVPYCVHGTRCEICCWEWQGCTDTSGYPKIRYGGKQTLGARIVWYCRHGTWPTYLDGAKALVLHTCDNRLCLNWHHHYLGTAQQNMDDKVARGRAPKGTQQSQAKLNDGKVRQLRRLYASGGWTHLELAQLFGVGLAIIGKVLRQQDWKHVH